MEDDYIIADNSDNREKYGPESENKGVGNTEADQEQGLPLEMPGQTKKVIFQFYNQDPEMGRVKPLYGAISRKFIIAEYILLFIAIIEFAALGIIEQGYNRIFDWCVAGIIALSFLMTFVIFPARRRKLYKERVAAGEMSFLYTFFEDCVILKNNSMEINLKYDTAQFYAENKEAIVVGFQYGKSIVIDKTKCTTEQVDFIRNIVPESNMAATRKKTAGRRIVTLLVVAVAVVVIGVFIFRQYNYYPNRTEYVCTTYESFYGCVGEGNVKDIVIYNNKFIEYTFTGYVTDERYYTIYTGNMDDLVHYFDSNHTNWVFK